LYSNESAPRPFVFHRGSHIAGRSIEDALAEYRGHPYCAHMTPLEAMRGMGRARWDSAFHFTFVRNPWARAVSCWYRWHRDRLDFADFVRSTFGPTDGGKGCMPITTYLCHDFPLKDYLHFVGRFETLEADYSLLLTLLGITGFPLGHAHANDRRKPYRDYYTDETRRIVGEHFSEDCQVFGYSWDDEGA